MCLLDSATAEIFEENKDFTRIGFGGSAAVFGFGRKRSKETKRRCAHITMGEIIWEYGQYTPRTSNLWVPPSSAWGRCLFTSQGISHYRTCIGDPCESHWEWYRIREQGTLQATRQWLQHTPTCRIPWDTLGCNSTPTRAAAGEQYSTAEPLGRF